MCYPCTMCNGCGKLDPGSPLYMAIAVVKCLDCGSDVDSVSGKCLNCGKQVMIPLGDDPVEPAADSGAERPTASEPDCDAERPATSEPDSDAERPATSEPDSDAERPATSEPDSDDPLTLVA